jgi:hypothetical protein
MLDERDSSSASNNNDANIIISSAAYLSIPQAVERNVYKYAFEGIDTKIEQKSPVV